MAGIALETLTEGLTEAFTRLERLGAFAMADLADDAGALLESSARGRFDTAEAPDGTAWTPWTEDYADTREEFHGLLVASGGFRDSIAAQSQGGVVRVGSPMVFAAHHQLGGEEIGTGMPARPVLGVSQEDEIDLRDLIADHLRGMIQ